MAINIYVTGEMQISGRSAKKISLDTIDRC